MSSYKYLLTLASFCFAVIAVCAANVVDETLPSCTDAQGQTTCYFWRLSGSCRSRAHRDYMFQICRRTCDLCPSVYIRGYKIATKRPVVKRECHDKRKRCHRWKSYCATGNEYYNFMKKHCRRTCLFCADKTCRDKNSKCKHYETFDYCQPDNKYFTYMRKNCQQSCQFCTSQKTNQRESKEKRENLQRHYACDFEDGNACDWSNQIFEDNGDWLVGIDKNNGPKLGYNNSNNYLYTDITYRGYNAKLWLPWQLILPYDFNSRKTTSLFKTVCFQFVYRLHNARLIVWEEENPTMEDKQLKHRVVFDTKTDALNWTSSAINVQANERYNLIVVGERFLKDSLLALDDFYFTKGSC